MHNEIKSLCQNGKISEAIDFASRIKPAPGCQKTEDLVFIGNELLQRPDIGDRNALLARVIEGLLQLGDVEHPSKLIRALSDGGLAQRFSQVIENALRLRQTSMVDNGF